MDSVKTTAPLMSIEADARAVIEQVLSGKPVNPEAGRAFGRFHQVSWRHGDERDYS